jgi:hypothetical protein
MDDIEKLEKVPPTENNANEDVLSRFPTQPDNDGKRTKEATKIASPKSTLDNTLSRTYSRITNRHIVDPGPAPDGGLKAWIQVLGAFLTCVATWGYINSVSGKWARPRL